jgi:hypothetical protein
VSHKSYDEVTGILYLDAGVSVNAADTSRLLRFTDNNIQTDGYIVVNASKSPALTGVPLLQQRIAILSDVKSAGSNGGTSTTSYSTRVLNTIVDDTGIVSSFSLNQFTLPPGEYLIDGYAPSKCDGSHKAKIRNITDSTDAILGSSAWNARNDIYSQSVSIIIGRIVINQSKTFALQHKTAIALANTGFGQAYGGDSETYAIVKIQKIK